MIFSRGSISYTGMRWLQAQQSLLMMEGCVASQNICALPLRDALTQQERSETL